MPMSIWVFHFSVFALHMENKYQELLLRFSLWLNIFHRILLLCGYKRCSRCREKCFHFPATGNFSLFQLHYWCCEAWSSGAYLNARQKPFGKRMCCTDVCCYSTMQQQYVRFILNDAHTYFLFCIYFNFVG